MNPYTQGDQPNPGSQMETPHRPYTQEDTSLPYFGIQGTTAESLMWDDDLQEVAQEFLQAEEESAQFPLSVRHVDESQFLTVLSAEVEGEQEEKIVISTDPVIASLPTDSPYPEILQRNITFADRDPKIERKVLQMHEKSNTAEFTGNRPLIIFRNKTSGGPSTVYPKHETSEERNTETYETTFKTSTEESETSLQLIDPHLPTYSSTVSPESNRPEGSLMPSISTDKELDDPESYVSEGISRSNDFHNEINRLDLGKMKIKFSVIEEQKSSDIKETQDNGKTEDVNNGPKHGSAQPLLHSTTNNPQFSRSDVLQDATIRPASVTDTTLYIMQESRARSVKEPQYLGNYPVFKETFGDELLENLSDHGKEEDKSSTFGPATASKRIPEIPKEIESLTTTPSSFAEKRITSIVSSSLDDDPLSPLASDLQSFISLEKPPLLLASQELSGKEDSIRDTESPATQKTTGLTTPSRNSDLTGAYTSDSYRYLEIAEMTAASPGPSDYSTPQPNFSLPSSSIDLVETGLSAGEASSGTLEDPAIATVHVSVMGAPALAIDPTVNIGPTLDTTTDTKTTVNTGPEVITVFNEDDSTEFAGVEAKTVSNMYDTKLSGLEVRTVLNGHDTTKLSGPEVRTVLNVDDTTESSDLEAITVANVDDTMESPGPETITISNVDDTTESSGTEAITILNEDEPTESYGRSLETESPSLPIQYSTISLKASSNPLLSEEYTSQLWMSGIKSPDDEGGISDFATTGATLTSQEYSIDASKVAFAHSSSTPGSEPDTTFEPNFRRDDSERLTGDLGTQPTILVSEVNQELLKTPDGADRREPLVSKFPELSHILHISNTPKSESNRIMYKHTTAHVVTPVTSTLTSVTVHHDLMTPTLPDPSELLVSPTTKTLPSETTTHSSPVPYSTTTPPTVTTLHVLTAPHTATRPVIETPPPQMTTPLMLMGLSTPSPSPSNTAIPGAVLGSCVLEEVSKMFSQPGDPCITCTCTVSVFQSGSMKVE